MLHAWGMTEMSPLGTCGSLLRAACRHGPGAADAACTSSRAARSTAPRCVSSMTRATSCRATGDRVGEIQVRGPWVLSGYFKGAGGKVVDDDGWFRTGDVAHMDADGFITITDRAKDVIKSGGEWISSIEIENLAVGHPGGAGGRGDRHAPSALAGTAVAAGASQAGRRRDEGGDAGSSCRARSPNGGCPTTWCSSRNCRTPRPARC